MKAIIYSNKITITPINTTRSYYDNYCKKLDKLTQDGNKGIDKKRQINLNKKGTGIGISKSASKTIRQTVNEMYILTPLREKFIKCQNKTIKYRLSNITLTLPSAQKHSDKTIKQVILDPFLTLLRNRYSLKNYVWKLEYQKNGNIHFHLIADTYIDYQLLRRLWNKAVNKLGYVDRFSEKFNKMSKKEYIKYRLAQDVKKGLAKKNNNNIVNNSDINNLSISQLLKLTQDRKKGLNKKELLKSLSNSYCKGKKTNFTNPNSIDVNAIRNNNQLGYYIAKYVSKDEIKKTTNTATGETKKHISISHLIRLRKAGRFWGRSESLSRLKHQNYFLYSEIKTVYHYIKNQVVSAREFCQDYFKVLYFNFKDLPKEYQKWIKQLQIENARMYNYRFPT